MFRSPRLRFVDGILGKVTISMISLVLISPGFISEMRRAGDGEDFEIRRMRRRKQTTILEVRVGTDWLGPDYLSTTMAFGNLLFHD